MGFGSQNFIDVPGAENLPSAKYAKRVLDALGVEFSFGTINGAAEMGTWESHSVTVHTEKYGDISFGYELACPGHDPTKSKEPRGIFPLEKRYCTIVHAALMLPSPTRPGHEAYHSIFVNQERKLFMLSVSDHDGVGIGYYPYHAMTVSFDPTIPTNDLPMPNLDIHPWCLNELALMRDAIVSKKKCPLFEFDLEKCRHSFPPESMLQFLPVIDKLEKDPYSVFPRIPLPAREYDVKF